MFQLKLFLSNYNTRSDKDLHVAKIKLEFSKKGFQYTGIRAWNDIPNNIRELSSLSLFKSHLRIHLMSNETNLCPLKRMTPCKISGFISSLT